jgi:hypothetical protein
MYVLGQWFPTKGINDGGGGENASRGLPVVISTTTNDSQWFADGLMAVGACAEIKLAHTTFSILVVGNADGRYSSIPLLGNPAPCVC